MRPATAARRHHRAGRQLLAVVVPGHRRAAHPDRRHVRLRGGRATDALDPTTCRGRGTTTRGTAMPSTRAAPGQHRRAHGPFAVALVVMGDDAWSVPPRPRSAAEMAAPSSTPRWPRARGGSRRRSSTRTAAGARSVAPRRRHGVRCAARRTRRRAPRVRGVRARSPGHRRRSRDAPPRLALRQAWIH